MEKLSFPEEPKGAAGRSDERSEENRMGAHTKLSRSPIAGLKPFILVGLVAVAGLLVGLDLLLHHGDETSLSQTGIEGSQDTLTPGAITIGEPPAPTVADNPSTEATTPTAPSEDSTPASEFTFYETLKKPPHDPAGTVGLLPKSTPAEPPTKPAAPVAKAAKHSAPKSAAHASSPAGHVIATASVADGKLHYTVQVGAFREQPQAERLKADLTRKGHEAYVMSAKLPDGMTYRVRVGKFTTRDEATAAAKQLAAIEGLHPFVATVQPNS
jgi:cell division septation protein DedD